MANSIDEFKPARIVEIELSRPLAAITSWDPQTGRQYGQAHALVRLHGQPLGLLPLNLGTTGLPAAELKRQIWPKFADEINTHLQADGFSEINALSVAGLPAQDPPCHPKHLGAAIPLPRVSIVVATRDRPESLKVCLNSLLALHYPGIEIVVVDSAPRSDRTLEILRLLDSAAISIHYLRCDQPGLANAHNLGLMHVVMPLVVFTDDDVVVDPDWLLHLTAGFIAAEDVGCVTGLIVPAELETRVQLWGEQLGRFGKGFARQVFDLELSQMAQRLYPYSAGLFGTGANMAFRTDLLQEIGGFDSALGVGTIARGGDDLSAFFQVINSGQRLVYEPAAIVFHRYSQDYASLRKRAFGYGVGLTAYLTSVLFQRPKRIFDMVLRIPLAIKHILDPRSEKNEARQSGFPRELKLLELGGMFYGPLAYLRSRFNVRQWSKLDVNVTNLEHGKSQTRSLRYQGTE